MAGRSGTPASVLIAGAGGRDFHVFNTLFRANADYDVVAFTAAQIPGIAGRTYPAQLSGPGYPNGIPIFDESRIAALIDGLQVDEVVFAYSDVSHQHVMHLASRCLAAGAAFRLLAPQQTWLEAAVPVIAVCAVRSGAGKSPTSRAVTAMLRAAGRRPVVVRHPMPYGPLQSAVQRFAHVDDLVRYGCTIEEREEYEPHIAEGNVVYAGVDYAHILAEAQTEADILVWDGGNNDLPFYRPDLLLVVADPLRAGHELAYHPGETCLRMADAVLINKVDAATQQQVALVENSILQANPAALVLHAASPVTVDQPGLLSGSRVLVVEDGPTTTHGGLGTGAGYRAALQHGATLVDPRPWAVGSIAETYRAYPHLGAVLPAMGYSPQQRAELRSTIDATPCDAVVVATPIDLKALLGFQQAAVRVRYSVKVVGSPTLGDLLRPFTGG